MKISLAISQQCQTVYQIVQETIQTVYPRYYPAGVVQFFLDYHNPEAIQKDIENNRVYLLETVEGYVATGSITEEEIGRLYVLPQHQGRGYGTKIMDVLEPIVFQQHPAVVVDAAFPAFSLYEKRGYRSTGFYKYQTDNGDILCYHKMILHKP